MKTPYAAMNNLLNKDHITTNNKAKTTLAVFVGMVLLSCLATYPLVTNIHNTLIGYPEGDSYEMMWLIWWLKKTVFNPSLTISTIPLLFHPHGLTLSLLHTQIGAHLLALPFAASYGAITAYNITMLMSLAFSGVTAYLLGLNLTGSRLASVVCGVVWAFFPNKMGHALSGHLYQVAVFWLPLYVLYLLRALDIPTLRSGVMVGVFAVLVACVHMVHVAYFLLPVTILMVAVDWKNKAPKYWSRNRVVAFGSSIAVFSVFLYVAYFAVLKQAARGEIDYMPVTGLVGFSVDLLSFFLPAPNNPIAMAFPGIRDLSGAVNITFSESIAYLGVFPIMLAFLAIYKGYGSLVRWLVLGVTTMVLSLGPLLKIGGRVVETQIDNISSPIVLPYALLANLPFFEWSRTPARLHATTHLVLAILVAYGAAILIDRFKAKWHRLIITFVLTTIIFLEYLVVFPFPVTGTESRKVHTVAKTETGAVLPLPVTNSSATEALFGQTINEQPIIGGRLFRDMPKRNTIQRFLQEIVVETGVTQLDIVRLPTNHERRAVLRRYDTKWVTYHNLDSNIGLQWPENLEMLLGPPVSVDENIALFALSDTFDTTFDTTARLDMVYTLGSNWHPVENWNNTPTRWFYGNGEVYVYSSLGQEAMLSMTLIPELEPHVVAVKVNGELVTEISAGDWLEFQTPTFSLDAGLNLVELVDVSGSRAYVGDLRCAGGTPLSGAFVVKTECDPSMSDKRMISAGVQEIEIIPVQNLIPNQGQFGKNINLLNSYWQTDLEAGNPLRVTLYWSADEKMNTNWTNFVHIRGPDNQIVSGVDQQPMVGGFPTERWSPGQIVAYTIVVPIPEDTLTGKHTIDVGWYQWPSLERMRVESEILSSQNNLLTLGEFTVRQTITR